MNRWKQIEKLCQSALELEEGERAAFMDQACAGDEELRREVESLLQFDGRGDRKEAFHLVEQRQGNLGQLLADMGDVVVVPSLFEFEFILASMCLSDRRGMCGGP